MKNLSLSLVMLTSLASSAAQAAAPAQQTMDSVAQLLHLTKENEQLKAQLKNGQKNKQGCCATLYSDCKGGCNNVGSRTDNCLVQRCTYPFAVATCQTDHPCCEPRKKTECNFAGQLITIKDPCANTRIGQGVKLFASLTCLLPIEITCCPPYALCDATCAKQCLRLE